MTARRLQLIEPEAGGDGAAAGVVPRLRIAIATQDMKALNAHFGSARRFAVWDVTPDDAHFVEAVGFDDVSDESGAHKVDVDDRIGPKVDALAGCNLLFVLAIGGPAAAKVVGAHIHPVKLPAPQSIASVIERVQTMMKGNPPPWLRKVMGAAVPRSMDFLDEED
ncbi:nitrogen fixation protein NifX [Gluconacetobacter diazotrophicus PA1 5]|uniref:Protein nifX n=2 Tax=Gluconacetobacter diazotrophicus TaxID=33996 RepID=A9H5X7_GLUDA|nr:nitrogen fixation protein NifX [Gluconacetobacter diazotrophicus]AAG27067.1 NifX [Gluconacetobacter diazotrophicus PA1 5]ACI51344.1 nitrogen fixation protein NifX [Gluconacetobacter diazotrophicus PA1 5]MBB2157411.1 nitrogen fixation protein NifX [Gluconacetobacter diazotrophicus]TWB09892.1 nitrogen fixation protein NifX [Gluconacetobacter diazotrophicus]CAP54384.1 Protein nifX [Gluconacetobacter diazotrophicus PA1 5]